MAILRGSGLYDRRYAPRLGGKVVHHLSALLDESEATLSPLAAESVEDGRLLMLQRDNTRLVVALPQREFTLDTLPAALTPRRRSWFMPRDPPRYWRRNHCRLDAYGRRLQFVRAFTLLGADAHHAARHLKVWEFFDTLLTVSSDSVAWKTE